MAIDPNQIKTPNWLKIHTQKNETQKQEKFNFLTRLEYDKK